MTGYGTASGPVGTATLVVEVRSVNHRFFSPALKLPPALARWESEVRDLVRRRVARGHVTVTARLETERVSASRIDPVAFADAVTALRELRDRHGLEGDLDLATVLRVPGVTGGVRDDDTIEDAARALAIIDDALQALLAMRLAEGARLGVILGARLDACDTIIERLAQRAPERVTAYRQRLTANVAALLNGVAVDEHRVAQEVALSAERWDIGEEIDRFRSHGVAFRQALRADDDEPVGKRLGFLLQELLREANTTGSKSNDAEMQRDVVAVKEELERLREQVENLE
jgi:uncharacterized protein (TIGR00255 family)